MVSDQSQDEAEQQPKIGRIPALIAAVAVVGIAIGAAAGLLTLMLYQVERFALGYIENAHESGPFNVPAIRRAISVTVGASIAAVMWWLLRTRTTEVPSVKKAVGGAIMPVWQTIVHVLLQIFIVGTGMSIGREVAPRELGAMFGQRFARWVRLGAKDTRMLVAITAAAGLAGVYNAPLAGTFFAVEILLADVTLETVTLAFACSALASWVASLVKGTHVFYLIGKADGLFTPDYMLFALIAGLMLGVAGALFRRGSQWAERNKPSGAGILWMMPLAGLLTGVVAIAVPQVMGNGRATAQLSFSSKADLAVIPVLLLSFVAKAIVTLLTIRSGASGGVLQPGIALGASGGAILGILWMQVFHTNSIGMYALLGACALLAASQQAPLMAICLVMELADAPINLFVPISLAVAVSAFTASRLAKPLAAWHLPRAKAADRQPSHCRLAILTWTPSSHGHQACLAGKQHGEYEPVVVGADRHLAAVLLRDVPNRLHAEAMPMLVIALRGAQIALGIFLQPRIVIILDADHGEGILFEQRQFDEPLFRIGQLRRGFDRIVDRIAEQRSDIHRRHVGQERPIRHGGEADAAIGASALFCGEDDVKHGIAGMLLGAVALHRLLQLLESCRSMLRIDFGAQCRDLMLQIVREPTKRFDVLLRLQVLLMLAFQLRVD